YYTGHESPHPNPPPQGGRGPELPANVVHHVEQFRRAVRAGVVDEIAGIELGVTHHEVAALGQVEVGEQIELLADSAAGGAVEVGANRRARRVVQSVGGAVEAEEVVLEVEGQPFRRVQVEMAVPVANVLPAYEVERAEIVMAGREQLIERRVVPGV